MSAPVLTFSSSRTKDASWSAEDVRSKAIAGRGGERALPPRLVARLLTLDPEQLQIVEIVVAAIQRGQLPHPTKGGA